MLDFDGKSVNALVMLARLEAVEKEAEQSRKTFEKVLQECDRYDVYSLVSLGNYWLQQARQVQKQSEASRLLICEWERLSSNSSLQKESHYRQALLFFDKALKLDEKCVYAGNGVAIAVADQGDYAKAKDMFAQIVEILPQASDPMVNLGHTYIELQQYQQAIIMVSRSTTEL